MTNIVITGASSGLGAALARVHAAPAANLFLWGRDERRLEATANECRERGALVETAAFDLRNIDLLTARIQETDRRVPVDLAIFNAGIGGVGPSGDRAELAERSHEIAMVNFTAPVVGATLFSELMTSRGRGQIVLIGSIAESFPLPMAPTYAATKAGLALFAEALQLRVMQHGVAVTLVSPGFIDTPMSRQVPTPKPFLMTADVAAAVIARKISGRRGRVVVPWPFAVIRGLSRLLPRAVTRAVLRRL